MMLAPLLLALWTEHPTRQQALDWLLVDAWPLRVSELAAKALIPPDEDDPDLFPPPPEWMG